MSNKRKEDVYSEERLSSSQLPKLLKLGLISASSALVGGFAAAWWYRKTLTKLQNPVIREDIQKSESGNGQEDDFHF
jgi:hypothetical protein